jgi:hypothetical protein
MLYYYKFEYVNPEFEKNKPLYGAGALHPLDVKMKKI